LAENNYYKLGINGSLNVANTNHHISYSKTKSDGYRLNTEFENYSLSMNNSIVFNKSVIKTMFGYTDKNFGANSYYTTRFPNQAEKTKTYFASISYEIELTDFSLSPKIYWRKNEDEFVLNKSNPSFYKNNHRTNVYGGELQTSTNVLGGSTSFGLEYILDDIVSNNLGEHNRETKGFFIEQKINVSEKLNFSMGGFAYYYSEIDWKFWPGVDLAFSILNNLKIFANYGRAFRVPTYTELYYSDPISQGNSALEPEESNNYEIGLNFREGIVSANTSYFRKEGKNLIDYVFDNEDNFWKARNFTKINTDGFEIGFNVNLTEITSNIFNSINFDYTYLNSNKADLNVESRYVLQHLRHDLTIKLHHLLPFGAEQSWTVNYEDRVTLDDHFTTDTKITKRFTQFDLFIKVSNLLNKSYEEIPGVPLPGRWIIGGIKLNLL